MTESAQGVLDGGIDALGLDLDGHARQRLADFTQLLARWGEVYNLTALRDPMAVATHHMLDCLAMVAPLRHWTHGAAVRLLDVGSGAGLPGVIIALTCPGIDVTCVDAAQKKVAFLTQVIGALELPNLRALHGRVERVPGPFDLITARAFASLERIVSMTDGALSQTGAWVAMKGQIPSDEIAALPPNVEMFHVEPLTVPRLDAARCLVWMRRRAARAG